MREASTDKATEHLREAREYANRFAASLPDRIEAAVLTLESKLPFKALSIRELLLHRMTSLCSSAVDLFEQKRVIPAVILTRAIVETVAVLFVFNERLEAFLKDKKKNIHEIDDFLMRCLVGGRNNPDIPTPINILTFIDRVEKTVPSFRDVYDALCEYAHPNWAGTFGAFGEIDKEKLELKLGPTERSPAYSTGVAALLGSLKAFEHYYNDSGDLVRQFNDYFEGTRT